MLRHRFSQAGSIMCRLVMLACLLQPGLAWSAPGVQDGTGSRKIEKRTIADIALQTDGVLQGQVINAAGSGESNVVLKLSQGKQTWQSKTDAQGWFRIQGLRGGTYKMQADNSEQLMRVWAPGTAPPHAKQGVLILPSTDVIRGQRVPHPRVNEFFRFTKRALNKPLVVGGIVATAVAIPVAIHNSDDDPPATP